MWRTYEPSAIGCWHVRTTCSSNQLKAQQIECWMHVEKEPKIMQNHFCVYENVGRYSFITWALSVERVHCQVWPDKFSAQHNAEPKQKKLPKPKASKESEPPNVWPVHAVEITVPLAKGPSIKMLSLPQWPFCIRTVNTEYIYAMSSTAVAAAVGSTYT